MDRESDSRHYSHGRGKGGIVRFEFDKLDDAPARH
jgi:nitrate reductase alpha subunit